jgi:hypothetical protein
MRLSVAVTALALVLAGAGLARAEIVIRVDKDAQQMTVMRDGDIVGRWQVSTGRRGYSTPSGSFRPFRMEADHHSDEWDDAPMPHSIFFTMQGHAIHGTYETKHLGSAVSHGCVRISAEHASELFAIVKADGMASTKVIVSGGRDDDSIAIRRRAPREAEDITDQRLESYGGSLNQTPLSPAYPPQQVFSTPRY